jgi:hypothetical protein
MASPKQIEANRRNARKSTGPRTPAGRAASSRNALRHGLTAYQIVVPSEREKDFNAFYQERYEALAPADSVAEGMVERIITCEWRLRRIYRLEGKLMSTVEHTDYGYSFERTLKQITAVSRYETAMDRALQRARHELERHQARSRGEKIAAPIAITVSGTLDVEDQLQPSQEGAPEPQESANLPPSRSEQLGEDPPCPADPKPTK